MNSVSIPASAVPPPQDIAVTVADISVAAPREPNISPDSPRSVRRCRVLTPDELQHLDQRLAQWVPNDAVRAHLRSMARSATSATAGFGLGHDDVFTPAELPFGPSTLVWFRQCGTSDWWMPYKSIIFPYHLAIGSMLYSMVVAMAALLGAVKAHIMDDGDVNVPLALVSSVMPVPLFAVVMHLLHEYPCRIYLYQRLWEHKIAVDFKSRSFTHPVTMFKIGSMVWLIAFYLWLGLKYQADAKFFLVMVQSFGTVGWIMYSNLAVDSSLVPINSALRHFQDQPAIQDSDKTNASPPARLAHALASVRFVKEQHVKYDILAISRFAAAAATRKYAAKDDAAQLALLTLESDWLQLLATWIGRLGHTVSTVPGTVRFFDREFYALNFIRREVFDDSIWDAFGTFGIQRRDQWKSGNQILWSLFLSVLVFACVVELSIFRRPV